MGLLRREKGAEIARAALSFYARDDGELTACTPSWQGDQRLFLLLPGLAFDEYLPYVRIAHGKLGDSAKEAVLDEIEQFVEEALDAVEPGDPPLRDALPLVHDYPGEIAAQATITIRLAADEGRLWADTSFAPKKARDVLFFVAPRVCWDWVFTALADEPETAAALLTDLLLLCDDYRENGIPDDFSLKGIGRAPFRLWMSEDGQVEDLRETAAMSVDGAATNGAEAAISADPRRDHADERQAKSRLEPLHTARGLSALNGELFEEDTEHEAYWGAVSDVLQSADRSAIPDIARQMTMNHLQHMQSLTGGDFERWIRDLAESFADAYVLTDEEE